MPSFAAGYSDAERAALANVSSYLMKPVSEHDLLPAIALAVQRFKEFQSLHQEVDEACYVCCFQGISCLECFSLCSEIVQPLVVLFEPFGKLDGEEVYVLVELVQWCVAVIDEELHFYNL